MSGYNKEKLKLLNNISHKLHLIVAILFLLVALLYSLPGILLWQNLDIVSFIPGILLIILWKLRRNDTKSLKTLTIIASVISGLWFVYCIFAFMLSDIDTTNNIADYRKVIIYGYAPNFPNKIPANAKKIKFEADSFFTGNHTSLEYELPPDEIDKLLSKYKKEKIQYNIDYNMPSDTQYIVFRYYEEPNSDYCYNNWVGISKDTGIVKYRYIESYN